MNVADHDEHLPTSVGGVLGFALRSWAADARLYLLLAGAVFALTAIAEAVMPAAAVESPQGQFKLYVLLYTELFAGAYLVSAVALGVAARGLGTPLLASTIAGAATERWLPVIAVTFLAQTIVLTTSAFSGLDTPPEPRALVYIAAPLVWILWGILGLTAPFVALAQSRSPLTVLVGFGHAFSASLRRNNLLRLCILAAITVLPLVIETVLQNVLIQRHVPRALFWANIPIDALTFGPLTAIQTAFALDFARRANRENSSPPQR
ncbi:MAG TPA: hypothetical protein VFE70_03840 [Candidatus Elarobacter sp.]|nr:hypothetical protein [Candidatus Elarobacter sp.]